MCCDTARAARKGWQARSFCSHFAQFPPHFAYSLLIYGPHFAQLLLSILCSLFAHQSLRTHCCRSANIVMFLMDDMDLKLGSWKALTKTTVSAYSTYSELVVSCRDLF